MSSLRKHIENGDDSPLLKRNDLYNAALDAFSKTPFDDVSISNILRSAKINKGSFYFKFYDKLDLYLCMIELVAKNKMAYLENKMAAQKPTYNFFKQLHTVALGTLEYAKHDARFYSFWRIYLSEGEALKMKVKEEFPELTNDFLGEMIDAAIEAGQINPKYDRDFVHSIIKLYFNNLDRFVKTTMTDGEIMETVEQIISFLKNSLALPK